MDTIVVESGWASVYGFLEPQTIQPSGNTLDFRKSYIQTWMTESNREIYIAPYIDAGHWQLMVIILKKAQVVWFCSLHRKIKAELKSLIQTCHEEVFIESTSEQGSLRIRVAQQMMVSMLLSVIGMLEELSSLWISGLRDEFFETILVLLYENELRVFGNLQESEMIKSITVGGLIRSGSDQVSGMVGLRRSKRRKCLGDPGVEGYNSYRSISCFEPNFLATQTFVGDFSELRYVSLSCN
ncbi:hypothetical protein LR48_Vigan04g133000 [Vigna angularis]|uniref:Ubiquitin-like protease family profile domain-containing protein n=1 Tax=Phaseolus angularis TaxID=3914 RepID=A0A0L9UEZ8_PHAAN|nr:hypothetical protein LR48_Vigan04g133000 [Vigna angularis]